ncbi:MAG: ABC transporter ATP-binding protein [Clostridium sp.]|jgi:ATP-binding cassette subfamily B protein|uniref:ABC transporter ATP-binding protein n=1 Tax=Clostridium TaxID=1485 RepID=UPI00115711DC|nr:MULTISPECIES: ABC transporter ATP-binding protein [Clostridium]MDB1943672.1 ABC transporter ATP-binding protein [Clostridium tertium]MDB1951638.1 ABC transporter ATP-binding protein [Clostridium tertium]MDB1969817.1 ABC transporter ATP-binding protein [Clostridium tertium]MDU1278070.1 ABC transporter ATP-binding protein [Clostridium sp.]MDU1566964.1 ABC transporter ATP-binding protein [Clostridium sp.]
MDSLKWIFSYLKKYKFKYLFALLLVLFTSAINMVNPFISGRIVDKVLGENQTNLLIPLILTMIAIIVFKGFITYAYQMILEKISQRILFKIRTDLYEKLLELDVNFYSKVKTGDLMARMTGDTDAIRHFVAWVVYNILSSVTTFAFAIISMMYVNATLTIFMLFVSPLIGFFTFKMSKEISPTFHNIREAYSRLNSVVQENISGNRVVRAFGRETFEIDKFNVENKNYRDRNLDTIKVTRKYIPKLEFLSNSLSVVMILVGGVLVVTNKITLGELVIFNSLLWALNNPMRMCGYLINDTQRFIASSAKIIELLRTESNIKNNEETINLNKFRGDISFKNVSLDIDGRRVINNVSFEVKAGQTIGLVGHTGAGKSLIIDLLSRFYDATEGEIFIDGINIKDMDLDILRGNVAIAMQDIFLFSDTVKDNIAFSNPRASFPEVKRIAKKAQAHDFIKRLDEGYETIIGERGVGLSGGQKQRVSLARAMMKNASIFVLDDVTSAVDMETEKKIQHELKNMEEKKTTFIIAHRISSLKQADLILVLDNGEIVERGNHNELVKKDGYYSSIFYTQYGNLNLEVEGV